MLQLFYVRVSTLPRPEGIFVIYKPACIDRAHWTFLFINCYSIGAHKSFIIYVLYIDDETHTIWRLT